MKFRIQPVPPQPVATPLSCTLAYSRSVAPPVEFGFSTSATGEHAGENDADDNPTRFTRSSAPHRQICSLVLPTTIPGACNRRGAR